MALPALPVLYIVYRYVKKVLFFLLGFLLLNIIIFKFVPIPFTPLIIFRTYEYFVKNEPTPLKKTWVSIEEVSPSVIRAFIVAEDQKFLKHWGFDFSQIISAIKEGRGASTITQQTAKNVFLWQGRSWLRKVLEAFITILLEIFWGKKRIMEVYINVVELGKGIYGVEAAAQHYFQKSASRLNLEEAVTLAAILPNPRKWAPPAPSRAREFKKAFIYRWLPYYPPTYFSSLYQ
ncbi:MAG: monofunctional biosynthetic peptidoglycan transglycosylase [Bacteroidia bacterium]|nr:monofunctional biosynthetic peptidoglycan transglycosylase [Bacteroidia bacterium]MDW8158747.1 monofunctional biosynthetic peptidoglycan transglycosylase [Bacteroidia bacterium]